MVKLQQVEDSTPVVVVEMPAVLNAEKQKLSRCRTDCWLKSRFISGSSQKGRNSFSPESMHYHTS